MLAIGYMLNLSSKTASLTAILMSPILITSIVFMLLIEDKEEIYRKFYKEIFVKKIIENIDKEFKFITEIETKDTETMNITQIYKMPVFLSDTLVTTKINGVNFSISETSRFERRRSLKNRCYPLDFSGVLFMCDFDFSGWMAVTNKNIKSKFMRDKIKFKLVHDFNLYCDETSSRSSLASLVKRDEFLDNLCFIKDKFKGTKSLSAVFAGGKFYLFLNGAKSIFETELFFQKPKNQTANILKDEILSLISLGQDLRLSYLRFQSDSK